MIYKFKLSFNFIDYNIRLSGEEKSSIISLHINSKNSGLILPLNYHKQENIYKSKIDSEIVNKICEISNVIYMEDKDEFGNIHGVDYCLHKDKKPRMNEERFLFSIYCDECYEIASDETNDYDIYSIR